MSQSTQTIMTTPVNVLQNYNLLSNSLLYILIGAIFIIIFLLVLVVIILVTCCVMRRRAGKKTISPNAHTSSVVFEHPAHANEMYGQVASDNPVQEKGEEKIDLGMDKISLSNISSSNHIDV